VSKQKLRVKNTQLDNLVSNLRGEVGEIITSWVLLRHIMARERELMSDDVAKDMANENLAFAGMLTNKLTDEIVSRLSELGELKIGRLTFHFAATKLSKLNDEVRVFSTFLSRQKFQEKRNHDISHKELPEEWSQHKHLHIPYRVLVKGVAHAMQLMKAIDRIVLGPASKYLWREMRKKRYKLMNPASAKYMILPYLNLSREIRTRIVIEEIAEGRDVWSEMATTINGQKTTIPACRQWGAILLGGRMIVLDGYPLQELTSLSLPPVDPQNIPETLVSAEPITQERTINVKYRVSKKEDERISLAPVQKFHVWDDGVVAELSSIHINLNEQIRQDMGELNVGDEKEFSLTLTVLVGYQPRQA
jgi:hypothetical protein